MELLTVFLTASLTSLYIFQVTLAACPSGWQTWRQGCYIPVYETLDWFDSETICQRPGGNLFVTNLPEEREFILDMRTKWFGVNLGRGEFAL